VCECVVCVCMCGSVSRDRIENYVEENHTE
jgi:hypothetical protein